MRAPADLATAGERRTGNAEETRQLGRELARRLRPGDLVALTGELGTGKTCLIQGICAGLGVRDVVNSPTFILLHMLEGRQADGRPLPVFHFDLYRIGSREELEEMGASEFFHDPDALCLVEWAERAAPLLPEWRWEVILEYGGGGDERRVRWHRAAMAEPVGPGATATGRQIR